MGIKIGDLDVASEIVDLRYQLIRTQLLLEEILRNNPTLLRLDQAALQRIDDQALQTLQTKYPTMGIQRQ